MKKVLSALLVLTMVLSMICSITVSVSAATEEAWVLVFALDAFDGSKEPANGSKWGTTNMPQTTGTTEVIDGNTVLKIVPKGNQTIASLLAGDGDTYRSATSIGIDTPGLYNYANEYPAGTVVRAVFDAKVYSNSQQAFVAPAMDWTYFSNYVGGSLNGDYPTQIAGVEKADGWYHMTFPERTIASDNQNVIASNRRFRFANFRMELSDQMLAEGLYHGSRLGGKAYNFNATNNAAGFQITEANRCASWGDSVANGVRSIESDCTDLACVCADDKKSDCPRYQLMEAFVTKANTDMGYILLDNFGVEVFMPVYDNTINLVGATSASVTTNPVSGETLTVADGETVKVNRYHDLTVVVNGSVLGASYDGTAVEAVYDNVSGKTTITIPAELISADAQIKVIAGVGDYIYTRERTEWFKGGSAGYASNGNAAYYTTNGGLATFSFEDPANMTAGVGVIDEENGVFGWDNLKAIESRFNMRWNVYEVSNRNYERIWYATNIGDKDWAENYIEYRSGAEIQSNGAYNMIDDSKIEGAVAGPYGTSASNQVMRSIYPTWFEKDGYFETLPVVPAGAIEVTKYSYPDMKIKLLAGTPNGHWYATTPAFQHSVNDETAFAVGTSIRFYGAGLKETATYHSLTMNVGEGSYTALVDTMNFGTDTFTNVDYFGVEDYGKVRLLLKAPEGKVIKSVKVSNASGTQTIDGGNKFETVISLGKITLSGVIDVTYADNIVDSVVTLTETRVEDDLTVLIYGTVVGAPCEYGFKLSNGKQTAKLPALASNGAFAIRVTGLEEGTYTVTPYFVDSDDEFDGPEEEVEVEE